MKIAYFNDTYSPAVNGVVVAIKLLTREMSKKHDIQLHVPAYRMESSEKKEGKIIVERYASVPVPTYKEFQIVVLDYFKMAEILDKFNPDLVHVHSPGVVGLGALVWAKRRGKPVVGTFHALLSETMVYVTPHRLIPKADLMEIGRSGAGDSFYKRAIWKLTLPFFSRCDVVIVPSESMKYEVRKNGLKKEVQVISNGMDLTLFKTKEDYGLRKKVLHVGRLGYEKNVDVVLRMFSKIVKTNPEVMLTIVGDGPARNDLLNLAFELNISDKVIFAGWKNRDQLGEIYRSHDVFVTASAMETQGLVVLEAMLCGLPVVAVNKYALPDLVRHGQNGYLAGAGNWNQMAGGVSKLLADEGLRSKFGKKGRETAEGHDILRIAPKFDELYTKVVSNKYEKN